MEVQKTVSAVETFVELLRQQIATLQNDEYEYTHLDIYTAGTEVPWRFDFGSELEIDTEQGLLVARDGSSDELGNEGVPEYVIRLDAIVGSQLVV